MERNIVDTKVMSEIITDFVQMFGNLEGIHEEFFEYNDLGIPLAIAHEADLCSITPQGIEVLTETYKELIKTLKAPEGNYESLADILEASEDKE